MFVTDALNWGMAELEKYKIPDNTIDAKLLLGHILGVSLPELYLNRNDPVSKTVFKQYEKFIEKRTKRIPVAYILGETEFFGLKYFVNQDVLIPRPETELLVEETITVINETYSKNDSIAIVELGVGSGCVTISLAKLLNKINAKIYAVEIDKNAISVAQKNAEYHKVDDKIVFCSGDMYSPLPDKIKGKVDIIVSNPPYIAEHEFSMLQPEISYEPRIALDGGKEGDNYYQQIISQAEQFLSSKGVMILELGYGLHTRVEKIANDYNYKVVRIKKDYAGIERIMMLGKQNG